MSPRPRFACAALAVLFALTTVSCFAAATLTQQIDPPQVNVGDPAVVTLTIQGGTVGAFQFPQVDGIESGSTRFQINSTDDAGKFSNSVVLTSSFIPVRPGDFVLPAFEIRTQEGDVLHVKAMKLRAVAAPNSAGLAIPTTPAPVTPPTDATITPAASPVIRPGPVVMPPDNTVVAPTAAPNGPPAAPTGADSLVTRDPDGSLPKVFIIITPDTTDAYIGQSVGMEIDFFIRMDVAADQNSLPTIKGSDFLMNSFTTRGHGSLVLLENQQYVRETWKTAISAPKSGDFPLSMERDTYWIKSYSNVNVTTFFGNIFGGRKPNLAHQMVSSNQLTMHVLPLPEEGKPDHFSGAIGQFQVNGEALPENVAFGEPVTLHYNVSGAGNFDYVRCPVLPDDPEWKTYTPRSGTNYQDEAHLHAVKIFEQSVIPRKNGNVPLPAATFSYFDPSAKQYVTVPITLPNIMVTGTPPPTAPSPDEATDATSVAVTPKAADFLPNRLELGSLQTSLVPAYHQPWFWAVQIGLVGLPFIAALLLFIRARMAPDASLAARELRRKSVRMEEDAMSAAVRQSDARAFFLAARHAVQLQLGQEWGTTPEALTLREIRRRDPALAEKFSPLFAQADEVIYSAHAPTGLDLAQWEQRVRADLLQPQPA